jgi:hypothetical protein
MIGSVWTALRQVPVSSTDSSLHCKTACLDSPTIAYRYGADAMSTATGAATDHAQVGQRRYILAQTMALAKSDKCQAYNLSASRLANPFATSEPQ